MKTSFLSLLAPLLPLLAVACGGGAEASSSPASEPPPPSGGGSAAQPSGGETTDGCPASEPCIEADVTMTDGSTFHFARSASLITSSSGLVVLKAVDTDRPFGIALNFKPAAIRANQSYASMDTTDVLMTVTRAHPTEAKKTRLSSADGGTIIFSSTGADAPENATGTFDGVSCDRTEPDDTVHIRLANGRFRAGPT